MLLVVCIFFLLLDEKIFSNADCMIREPPQSNKFYIYLVGFSWRLPRDNFKKKLHYTPEGQVVDFYCENGFVDDTLPEKSYKLVCKGEKFNGTYHYEDLLCKSDYHKKTKTYVISNIQLGSDIFKCGGRNREVYQVGIEKPDGKFKPTYKVCFDKNLMKPKFVYQPRINGVWEYEGEPEQRWDVWGFDRYGGSAEERLKLTDGYVAKIQKARIGRQVFGISDPQILYPHIFSRGHMATYGHFMSFEERKATSQFINAIPQWKELNLFMWKYIESDIKELLMKNPNEWEIYTGSYGSIPTYRGAPLFLSPVYDFEARRFLEYVPIPKLIWKFVRNMKNERHSKVYVGINNPEFQKVEDITKDYLICKPIVRGRESIRGSASKGFVYECHVKEFLTRLDAEERIIKKDF